MSSNHKPVRSRFSSPLHSSSPSGHNRGFAGEGQRTFLQRWLEPPVQNKASFQEAGLMRGGVVENMAPLGTLPKAAMHKKSPLNGEALPTPPVKTRIVLKKPYVAATPRESAPRIRENTPDEVEAEVVEAAPLSPLPQPLLPVPVMDDGEDDDYVPKKSKLRTSSHHVTPNNTRRHSARRRSAMPSPTPVRSSPVRNNDNTTTTAAAAANAVNAANAAAAPSSPPRFHPPSSTLNREPDRELADRVVEAAVDEAIRHYRYPTAWALRLLYDDNSGDPQFISMIEDIYNQRADSETLKEFNRLISHKKKEGKKDNKGCYYFVPPSTGSRFTPHKPKPAPYGDLIKMDLSAFHDDIAKGHVNKKIKLDEDAIADESSPSKANGVSNHKGLTSTKSPHKSPHKSPKGRKTRSGSVSSSSSLSSVPDDVPDDYEEYMDQVDDDLGVARPIAAEENGPNNAQIPAGSTQPISDRDKKPAAKKKNGASPKHPPSTQTPRPHPPSRDSSMPAAVVANGTSTPNHQSKHQQTNSLKFTSRFGDLDDSSDQLVQKKLSKKCETTSATKDISEESFIRDPLQEDDSSFELAVPPPPTSEQYRSSRTPALTSRAARAAKRHHDDLDDSISPTAMSFRATDLEPSSARNSRAATPSNLRSSKKPRAGLRVKNSPMKKKGTSAGIPRSNGDRPSPVGYGAPNNQDDNDDSCYTCGGNGELVCCDGCNYSFHFLCIDPPMDEGHMPDEWYCNECKHRYYPPFGGEHKGALRSLFTVLERKNPRAFRLPEDIRDLFEGVRTGPEGEYEEITPPKPKTNKRGLDEPFDFFKVRNAEGPVLCHFCQKGVSDNRPIVPCSVCGLNWHLECLDPPLAVPPVPRTWRCPCHAEEILGELPERLAPAHRYRKIKNAPPIEPSYSRGLANNGWVEIDNDDSEDDADAWRKHKSFGRVYRLSAKGIKRDFISRVHERRDRNSVPVAAPSPAPGVQSRAFTLDEQQAALNLAQLAQGDGGGLNLLYQAMISEASPAMISMMASGDAVRIASGELASADVTSLEAMLAQLESVKSGIHQILVDRSKRVSENVANPTAPAATRKKVSPPADGQDDDIAIVRDGKRCTAGKGTTRVSGVNQTSSTEEDSAMQID
ncbi:hypothetical protein F5Y05DRAFT_10204 [Hypoxylon sp. FL0543]|nr:hypothetical protein F5Y05DRAFT_10204 [Hypoxylon sp. FL0543]